MVEQASNPSPQQPRVALRARGIEHAFGPREVLAGVDLDVEAGRCVALIGPSGCGKTTLAHLCAGLMTVQIGQIQNGFARTSVMFQQPRLLPWLSVRDNIALALHAHGVSKPEREVRAQAMAEALGLDALALRQYPQQLSGGMQSRAALARSLVVDPDFIVLDEPFSALDIGLKAQMHALLWRARRGRALAALLITHDVAEAVALADTVLVLSSSQPSAAATVEVAHAQQGGRVVWRLDVPARFVAQPRPQTWVAAQTAALLGEPVVRQTFGLSDLFEIASDNAPNSAQALELGLGQHCKPPRKPRHEGC